MKKALMIYKWILLAVLFQALVFSYLEFIYLPNRGAVKATAFEVSDGNIKSKNVRIPADAANISVSYNGFYAAYGQGNKIVLIDIRSGKKLKTLDASGGTFSYFRWLPDRDMLIYSTKAPDGEKGKVRISTYDVGPNLERSYPNIADLPEDSETVDIELSPLTNVVYAMIRTGDSKVKVYKYNIMDELSFVMNTGSKTVFKETAYSDNLVYQADGGKVTVRSGKSGKNGSLPVKESLVLLAVDSEDNVYAGQLDDTDKITAVHWGKLDQKSGEWKKTNLDTPSLAPELFITPNGSLYRVSRQDKQVVDEGDGSKISFEGEFLEVLDDYVVSLDGSRLKLTAIAKEEK